jgi:SMI1 / KNR4 family (SUKH-1)
MQIMNRLDKIIEKLKIKGFQLNLPASNDEIEQLEVVLNKKLPIEIKAFYQQTNGFDTLDYLFRFIPIEEIIENKSETEDSTILPIAEYMIYADTWDLVFDKKNSEKYKIVNSNHKSTESYIVSDTFYDFIELYLNGSGVMGEVGLYAESYE